MMTVIIAEHIPDAIRGILKRWFIEPKPNVFVGTMNIQVRNSVLEYVRKNSGIHNMLIISSDNSSQGFNCFSTGSTTRKHLKLSGLDLVCTEKESQHSIPSILDEAFVQYKPSDDL